MSSNRRVLTWATDQAEALRRVPGWRHDPTVSDPDSVKAEQVNGRWAVTAAKRGAS